MKRTLIAVIVFVALQCGEPTARASEAKRPKILGIAHVAFYVSDLQKARAFYEDLLGYQEISTIKRDDGSVRMALIKINDHQYLELFSDAPSGDGQLNHVAVYTDDAEKMRDYLAAHLLQSPSSISKEETGDSRFVVVDPDGHRLEVVQYERDSITGRNTGKDLAATRISTRLLHAGFLVASVDPAMKFYRDLLGFEELWRGSADGTQLSWINMRVPDGNDYVEFMLYHGAQSAADRGIKNHICLEVPDVQKAVAQLQSRPARRSYGREIKVQIGKNRKRQANLFDPDGTRIELMEPNTIDGKPAPSSTAPP